MKKEHVITWVVLIIIWQIAAHFVGNDILIPYPLEVFKTFCRFWGTSTFYLALGNTILRVFMGAFISFMVALIIALLANRFSKFRRLFEPIQVLAKTIPNISYIVITLIWLGSEGSVWVICLLILFPIFYQNFLFAFDDMDNDLKDVEKLYPETFMDTIFKLKLPQLLPTILATSKTALSLGFKVGVMAEILGQVKSGIGKLLYTARLNLDTTSIFALTIVIIIVCVLIDQIFDYFIKINKKEA